MARLACRSDLAKSRRAQKIVRQVEVGMIEEIEELGPELQIHSLRKCSVLNQRGVHVVIPGTVKNISSGVAKASTGWKSESRSVEPALGRTLAQIRIT